jgi:hypothetical protein
MQNVGLKIAVRMKGVVVDRPPKDFVPYMETRLRAEHAMSARFSPFTRGMLCGIALSLLASVVTAIAIAAKLWL